MTISEDEFRQLWQVHAPRIRAVLLQNRLLDPATTIDDIEQEIMLRVWRALSSETGIEHSASYIMSVTRHALIDLARRAQAREVSRRSADVDVDAISSTDCSVSTGEEFVQNSELSALVKRALAQLTENRRRAVSLRLQGLTVAEIACLCAWPTPKARNLVYRGLAQLRDWLEQHGISLDTELK